MAALRPNIIVAVTAIVVLLILFSLAQEMNRRWQVQREIARLQGEVRTMERKVVELQQLNEYFSTPDYKERLAREQLNFRAPGEKVVLIPEKAAEKQTDQVQKTTTTQLSVPLRWWYLFFVDTPAK